MQRYEAEARKLARGIAALHVPNPVVFYGSSSIRLWETLARDMGTEYVVNAGFGGSTLEECVEYFEFLVVPAKPSSLVIYAGENDVGEGRGPHRILGYYRELCRKIESHFPGIPTGFISIKPSIVRSCMMDRIARTNSLIQSEIAKQPTAYYIDVFTPMLGTFKRPRKELFLEDGLHLNADGYSLWTEVVRRHEDQVFSQVFCENHPNEAVCARY